MSHRVLPPKGTSPFNVPLATGENARKKIDNPKNIGFRGRHAHGKAPDDPVYPSRQLTASPKVGFVDWRTGGRALLVAAMAAIEGKILRTRGSIMKWQMFPPCSPKCGWSCHKARNRVLCSWFTPGTVHEHLVKMDGLLTQFKGAKTVSLSNPPFRPMSQVGMRNRFAGVPMRWNEEQKNFEHILEQPDPAFGINPELRIDPSSHPEDDGTLSFRGGYDSDEDTEAQSNRETHRLIIENDPHSQLEAQLVTESRHI